MLNPLSPFRWDRTTAAHLLNRAGFGGTPDQIEALAAMGMEKAVASLVNYETIPDNATNPAWAKPDPTRKETFQKLRSATEEERRIMQREMRQEQYRRVIELRDWWLKRMAFGPRPFQEKMTLFWHGHFATSIEKVRDAYLMWLQNETLRQHAVGFWDDILVAIAQDPAMLIWLDNAQSRKEHPNENFAREVMELFALGEGHYTEKDIQESARAYTGWTLNRVTQEFVERPYMHDIGPKIFLGLSGNLTARDCLHQIARQDQTARFMAKKLWRFFADENPSDALIDALAAAFKDSNGHFKTFMRVLFSSEEFYEASVIRSQVKSPVQWLVNAVCTLERDLPPPIVCSNILRLLGQELFAPPNVKGWDGGISWITTNTLLNRYNFAALLVEGNNVVAGTGQGRMEKLVERFSESEINRALPANANIWVTPEDRQSPKALISALEKRFLQAPLKETRAATLFSYLETQKVIDDDVVRHTVRLLMSTPDYQLT